MNVYDLIATQLKNCKTKEDFDSIINYHYKNGLPDMIREKLIDLGVDFNMFEKKAEPVKVAAKPKVNVKNLTKMVIDEPIVEEGEE